MDSISILQLLPKVFHGEMESHRQGDIWLTETTFSRGNRYLIHAESGGGKTSLCSFIYGLRTDFSGKILFDNVPISSLKPTDWARLRTRSLAYLPQNLELFPTMTVMENIMLKNSMTNHLTNSEISGLLGKMGIAEKADTTVALLSLGQQQRVALIRTLCQPMDFLILDEPVSHLDEANNRVMAEIIEDTLNKTGAGLITTSVGNPLLISNMKSLEL